MSVFDDPTRAEVERRLDALPGPVKLVYFRDPADPEGLSTHVSELLHEVADLGERVSLLEHDFAPGQGESARYAIARAPAIVVEGARDFGIRYYGVPAGYEFGTLLEVMADVAAGSVELPAGLRERLAGLRQPVHIQVFSTPT